VEPDCVPGEVHLEARNHILDRRHQLSIADDQNLREPTLRSVVSSIDALEIAFEDGPNS
jgi:hypothetical protein